MPQAIKLPSRADHVGSFLRPRSVIEAREHRAAGNIDYAELRAIEDTAIAELVKWQESLGLKAITDGEFRRYFFHTDFLLQLDGVEEHGGIAKAFHDQGATVGFSSAEMLIEKRVKPLADSIGADFVEACDVQKDEDIERVFRAWQQRYGTLDILVHCVAFAKRVHP